MRERIRAGDREAFAELYEEHARAVYHHALRLTGDWSAAEEIMSDTFLDAWRTRERVEPEGGSLKPWLLGIATNKAHNANRGRIRRLAFLARCPAPPPGPAVAAGAAARIAGTRQLAAVQAALGRLKRPEREVLALCVWAGLDYEQAAQALDIPVGTVRSRLSRARARLRRIADEEVAARREPPGGGGEKNSGAAFAALPVQEATR
ncbi:RNA polymerase sigma factor [Streptomyces sp. N35]|uniref:RNA polymerase sigma factor n=1 Tax=Streptomyces sp. N35 TaxID=2795730 RepID=UPI0018F51F00|nr:RNA polymerase sigma factor [Streptomyces sp. N35]